MIKKITNIINLNYVQEIKSVNGTDIFVLNVGGEKKKILS